MGYQVTFKPSAEAMEKYKPWNYGKYDYKSREVYVEETRLNILTYCMKEHDGGYSCIYRDLKMLLALLKTEVYDLEKESAYERWNSDKNKELWYCGWEFARPSSFDADELMKHYLEDFVIFTDVIKTPDYFENSEKFFDKVNELNEKLSGFIECYSDLCIHDIIDELDEFKLTYDEDDEEKGDSQEKDFLINENNENEQN